MDILEKHLTQVKTAIDSDTVSKELFDFIRSIENDITELNRKQLNEESKDIYGQAIGFYSYATELITKGRKKRGEPFDAKDTGGLLGGLYAKIQDSTIVFGSTDPKVKLIMDSDNWLSQDLFGLSDENLQEVIEKRVTPFIIDYYKKQLLG